MQQLNYNPNCSIMSVQIEKENSPKAYIEVTLQLTPKQFDDLERVRLLSGNPNLTTSIWITNMLIQRLYQLENLGGRLSVLLDGTRFPFRLPRRSDNIPLDTTNQTSQVQRRGFFKRLFRTS